MTDDMMALRTLLEKSSDADLLREMIGFTAQRLMDLEVQGLASAGKPFSHRNAEPRLWSFEKTLRNVAGQTRS
jgi:hypothetical protein